MKNKQSFPTGIRDGLPICFGYLSVAFAFGIFAAVLGDLECRLVMVAAASCAAAFVAELILRYLM